MRCVVLLERFDRERAPESCLDAHQGRFGSRHRRVVRNGLHQRRAANGGRIGLRDLVSHRIDHQLDLPILQMIHHMRPPLSHFIDSLHRHAMV